MASTAVALSKGALIIAVCFVLLHSSMGQQPTASAPAPAPLDCSNCTANCTKRCQAMVDSQISYCNTSVGPSVYDGCFQAVATQTCDSNSYVARGTCTIDTCTPNLCGSPCVQSFCDSCTATAHMIVSSCIMSVSRIMEFCMPDCANNCQEFGYCVSG